MKIELVETYTNKNEFKTLFSEYTDILIEYYKDFKEYLDKQNYASKLEHLESKYRYPYSRLTLAYCDNKLAGCIGLRKIENGNYEMNRLYVKPKFREKNIGNILVKQIIKEAQDIGYKHILIDTFSFLETATKLYTKMGFYKIESTTTVLWKIWYI